MDNNLTALQQSVIALVKLQNECTKLERDFHQKIYQLECEFNAKHNEIYAKRANIVIGEVELLNDDYSIDGIDLGAVKKLSLLAEQPLKGVPNFWLDALKNSSVYQINSDDEAILQFLIDIKLIMDTTPKPYFDLIFVFSSNPFFSDSTLTKRFFVEFPDKSESLFCYEGATITESVGCEIHWKQGTKEKNNDETKGTFFDFFKSSRRDDIEKDCDFNVEDDADAGLLMKDHLVPSAVLYYLADGDDNSSVSSNSSSERHSDDETILPNQTKSLSPIKSVLS